MTGIASAGAPNAPRSSALWTTVAPHFGLRLDAHEIAAMRTVAQRHSKRPGEAFVPAHDPSRTGAAAFRDLADAIVGPAMAALRGAG